MRAGAAARASTALLAARDDYCRRLVDYCAYLYAVRSTLSRPRNTGCPFQLIIIQQK